MPNQLQISAKLRASVHWGAVFPLGMYAASTLQMERAMNLSFLEFIPRYFLYIALFAWLVTFLGLAYTLARQILVQARK
ncbi:MAG: SLAC1 family transporter [Sulfuriferula sp.]